MLSVECWTVYRLRFDIVIGFIDKTSVIVVLRSTLNMEHHGLRKKAKNEQINNSNRNDSMIEIGMMCACVCVGKFWIGYRIETSSRYFEYFTFVLRNSTYNNITANQPESFLFTVRSTGNGNGFSMVIFCISFSIILYKIQ